MEQPSESLTEKYSMELSVPFPTNRLAEIAYNTLRVDKEPKKGGCTKMIGVEENKLSIRLEAQEARTLRVASNSILDFLALITDTMAGFDPQLENA